MKSEFATGLPKEWRRFAQFFSALGDATRQQIMLAFGPDEELCVNEIARLFRLSRPAISHHLKVLRDAQLLISEKRGKEVYYRINYAYCADVLETVYQFVIAKNVTPPERAGGATHIDRETASL
jgi:DNA-binding transcriptional ArsR family regulator